MDEANKFLEELEVKPESILYKPLTDQTEAPEAEPSTEEQAIEAKNRRERRLLAKLQAEREANIDLNARLQTIAEAKSKEPSSEDDFRSLIEPIYGNATPEAKAATDILEKALKTVQTRAEERAIEKALQSIRAEQEESQNAVAKEEENLETMLEELEDTKGANFSDQSTRVGFLNLLEKLSPKDKEGNVIEYADPETTWDIYQNQRQRTPQRAKDLAARGIAQSGSVNSQKVSEDATWRFLKEQGIF